MFNSTLHVINLKWIILHNTSQTSRFLHTKFPSDYLWFKCKKYVPKKHPPVRLLSENDALRCPWRKMNETKRELSKNKTKIETNWSSVVVYIYINNGKYRRQCGLTSFQITSICPWLTSWLRWKFLTFNRQIKLSERIKDLFQFRYFLISS